MNFKRGDIVEIIRVDDDVDPQWLGLRCEVADYTLESIVNPGSTRLVPLSDRPDKDFPKVDPRGWFFWTTNDLRLVNDNER